jgi:hypothetical protein
VLYCWAGVVADEHGGQKGLELKCAAGVVLSTRLQDVIEACSKGAKIHEMRHLLAGHFQAAMQDVIGIVLRAVYDEMGTDHRVAGIEARIRAVLEERAESGQGLGTELTPDMVVTEMDRTIGAEE